MGEGWETLMAAQLFGPTAMTSAGFGAPVGAVPWGHARTTFGLDRLSPVDPAGVADNPPVLGPAGTIHMNLADYAKFLRLFLDAGAGVLSADSRSRLTTPFQPGDRSYGLGWSTLRTRPWANGPVLAHEGSNTLWHAFTALAPVRQRAVVTVCNASAVGGSAACEALGQELIASLG